MLRDLYQNVSLSPRKAGGIGFDLRQKLILSHKELKNIIVFELDITETFIHRISRHDYYPSYKNFVNEVALYIHRERRKETLKTSAFHVAKHGDFRNRINSVLYEIPTKLGSRFTRDVERVLKYFKNFQ